MTRSSTNRAIRRATRRWAGRAGEAGQAALAMVLGVVMMLVTGGTLLATNAIQHDPLIQGDVLAHYAYRALEAGVNSYLNTINSHPNLVNCSATSTTPECTDVPNGTTYDTWTQVPNTTTSNGNVPEWYLWTNPQFCFSATRVYGAKCTSSSASNNFQYVQILVVGAAGTPGRYVYQSSVANFAPRNGFLTHLWWSDFESAPTNRTATLHACKWNYTNGYQGPGDNCYAVVFASHTHIDGPVYSNDSIYVTGTPSFGTGTTKYPITSADPKCQFVPGNGSSTTCANLDSKITYTTTYSHFNAARETPPSTDTELSTIAAKDGCLYSGPTTISFYATTAGHKGYMNVTSPDTPKTGTHDNDNTATNNNKCLGSNIPLPTGSNGNGVIYVTTATTSCAGTHVNPYEGLRTGQTVKTAQIVEPGYYSGTSQGYNYTNDPKGGTTYDCQGTVFVRDTNQSNTPSGMTRGVSGNVTVSTSDNIVITGTLTYADCGSTWTSKAQCPYHAGSVNDSLGLISQNFTEVNRPVKPQCTYTVYSYYSYTKTTTCKHTDGSSGSGWTLLGRCTTTTTDLQAALCNPAKSGVGLVIDAAILDLTHEFTVNNYGAGTSSYCGYSCSTSTKFTHTLIIYGTLDQYWRGAVGIVTSTGYNKYYTWDSRLQYVSIPYYLTPGTPSWGLVSTSVVLSNSCPRWPKAYPTGAKYLTTGTTTSSGTGKAPNGTGC